MMIVKFNNKEFHLYPSLFVIFVKIEIFFHINTRWRHRSRMTKWFIRTRKFIHFDNTDFCWLKELDELVLVQLTTILEPVMTNGCSYFVWIVLSCRHYLRPTLIRMSDDSSQFWPIIWLWPLYKTLRNVNIFKEKNLTNPTGGEMPYEHLSFFTLSIKPISHQLTF